MAMYFVVFASLAGLSFFENTGKMSYKAKKGWMLLIFAVAFILSGIRWQTGTDWGPYYSFFKSMPKDFSFVTNSPFEIAYTFLSVLIKIISENYTLFLFAEAAIIIFCEYKSVKHFTIKLPRNGIGKESDGNVFFVLLCLWSTSFFSIFATRRVIAFSICLFSLIYIQRKKFLQFIICLAVATLFHTSASIFIVAYFIYWIKATKNQIFLTTLIFIIVGILASNATFNLIAQTFPAVIADRIKPYLLTGGSTHGQSFSYFYIIFKAIANSIFIFILLFLCYDKNKNNKAFVGMVKIYCFGLIIYAFGLSIDLALASLSNPFTQVQVFLIPYSLTIVRKENRNVLFIVMALYLALRLYTALTGYDEGILYPYTSIFG